jgi:uncharacterized membrane protein
MSSPAPAGAPCAPCAPAEAPSRPLFDAVLYPNQSLGQTGFVVLMAAIVLVSVTIGAGFVMVGAWPVTGFLGLDVLLLYLAFRWSFRQNRRAEFIRLDEEGLTIRRVEPGGRRREWCLQPYWVRVVMDDPPRHDSQLLLVSHGQRLVIGSFLTPGERLDLAQALRAALRRHRGPS